MFNGWFFLHMVSAVEEIFKVNAEIEDQHQQYKYIY